VWLLGYTIRRGRPKHEKDFGRGHKLSLGARPLGDIKGCCCCCQGLQWGGMGTDQIISTIKPVLLKYGVSKAELFGSTAWGEMTDKSDVDILVQLPDEASLLDLVHLKQELEGYLGREVDVVTYRSVHPYIKDYVFSKTISVV